MPRVPTYQPGQVSNEPVRAPRASASGELFGLASDIREGANAAAMAVGKYMDQKEERKFRNNILGLEQAATERRVRIDSLTGEEQLAEIAQDPEWHKTAKEKWGADMSGKYAAAFDEYFTRHIQIADNDRHGRIGNATEAKVRVSQAAAANDAILQSMAANPTSDFVMERVLEVRANAAFIAKQSGASIAEVQAKADSAVSAAVIATANQLAGSGDPAQAAALVDAFTTNEKYFVDGRPVVSPEAAAEAKDTYTDIGQLLMIDKVIAEASATGHLDDIETFAQNAGVAFESTSKKPAEAYGKLLSDRAAATMAMQDAAETHQSMLDRNAAILAALQQQATQRQPPAPGTAVLPSSQRDRGYFERGLLDPIYHAPSRQSDLGVKMKLLELSNKPAEFQKADLMVYVDSLSNEDLKSMIELQNSGRTWRDVSAAKKEVSLESALAIAKRFYQKDANELKNADDFTAYMMYMQNELSLLPAEKQTEEQIRNIAVRAYSRTAELDGMSPWYWPDPNPLRYQLTMPEVMDLNMPEAFKSANRAPDDRVFIVRPEHFRDPKQYKPGWWKGRDNSTVEPDGTITYDFYNKAGKIDPSVPPRKVNKFTP
jgi:hypothetical protein